MSNNHQGPIKEMNQSEFQVVDLAFFLHISPQTPPPPQHQAYLYPIQLIFNPETPPLKVGKFLLGADRLILPPGVTHPKAPGFFSDNKNWPKSTNRNPQGSISNLGNLLWKVNKPHEDNTFIYYVHMFDIYVFTCM